MINLDEKSLLIENSISQEDRLKQGIFFTKQKAIELMCDKIDFSKVKSVIDTAAGTCNFLIYLANKYKHIQFYGIEKNKDVFNQTLKIVKDIPNIKYFNGDMFFDKFDIPLCDLYLGNPPWVNFIDLDEDYREKIKKIWTDNFKVKKDFRMLLGDSRGDLSQIFMYYTINNFLKDSGEFSVIMPITAIRSKNSSSSDFREFIGLTILEITEISNINPFANTNRTSCFIEGKKGGQTIFPIKYNIYLNETDIECKQLTKTESNLVFTDEKNISGKSSYVARQGINTLGANDIFFFKKEPKLESNIVKRLLKSSDIKKWKYEPSYWILLPYKDGKIIKESELSSDFEKEFNYLESKKEKLLNRKSKFVKNNYYQLFGVGEYTFKKYKVTWKGLGSKRLECVVVGEETMPNQSMNCYISTDSEMEAHYICAIMNSNFYESQLLKICESGSKSFAQPNIINNLKMPLFDSKNDTHIRLSQISKSFHISEPNQVDTEELERLVSSLY